MKSEKGEITIELVIGTIIFIVILGIFIFMLTGENGLFTPKEEKFVNEVNTTINEM